MQESNKNNIILTITKGVLLSVSVSLGLILLFAVVLKFFDMQNIIVKTINQIIKVISIFVGVLFSLKSSNTKYYLKGLAIGVLYTVVAFFVFSILDGGFSFSTSIIFDLLFSGVIGAICGIFCANISFKKRI